MTLSVICPDCSKWLNYDPNNEQLVDSKKNSKFNYGGVVVVKERITGTFGHDRLTIEQMKSKKEDALKAGHSHYFTGRPCRNGHLAPRTKRGECNECVRDYSRNHLKKIKQPKMN